MAERIVKLWQQPEQNEFAVVHLGGNSSDKRTLAATACAALGLQLHILDSADIPTNPTEREALAHLWEREAVLSRSALLIDCDDAENQQVALSFLEHVHSYLLVASRRPMRMRVRQIARLEVDKISQAEQLGLWKKALDPRVSATQQRTEQAGLTIRFKHPRNPSRC